MVAPQCQGHGYIPQPCCPAILRGLLPPQEDTLTTTILPVRRTRGNGVQTPPPSIKPHTASTRLPLPYKGMKVLLLLWAARNQQFYHLGDTRKVIRDRWRLSGVDAENSLAVTATGRPPCTGPWLLTHGCEQARWEG